MQHLGYTSVFCYHCEDITSHRIMLVKTTEGEFTLKLCCKCKPERSIYADPKPPARVPALSHSTRAGE